MRKIVQKNEVSIMKLSARRGLECRILHHLSQNFWGPSAVRRPPALKGAELCRPQQFACYFSIFSCYFKIYWHPWQLTKLFAYVNNNIHDIKRILQDKQFHLQLKSEQKDIIQNVLERKIQWQCYPRASERACVTFPPLILDKVRSYMQIISHDTLR
jgi:hypothetical protein